MEQREKQTIVKIILLVVSCVVFFTCLFLLLNNFCVTKLSEEEFKMYENVAYRAYEQDKRGDILKEEFDEGVEVEKTDTSIIVSSSDPSCYDKVVLKMQNGKPFCYRETDTITKIIGNGGLALYFTFLLMMGVIGTIDLY